MRTTVGMLLLACAVCMAQDPVKVAAGHYKLIAENDNVRLLEGNLAPGAKTAMHSHPALMAVMLSPGQTKWTLPDGKVEQSAPDMKRGAVIAMAGQSHVSENIGKTPLRVILIEFKKPAPAAAMAKNASSLANCKPVAESAYATAQLCTGVPGSVTAKHTHARDVVYVALGDIVGEIEADGKKRPLEMKKDTAVIAAPETHTATNKGKTPYELVVVDLK